MFKALEPRRDMIRKLRYRLRVKDRSKGLFDYAVVPSGDETEETAPKRLRRLRSARRRAKPLQGS